MKSDSDRNAFIIHGTYGDPDENWFPWLKRKLEAKGIDAYLPKFPTPTNQTLDNWDTVFENYKDLLNSQSIMIGHSLGPAFIINLLERIDTQIDSAFLVSAFFDFLDNPEFDELNKTFIDRDIDFSKVKSNCKTFYNYHSENDPYVPLDKARRLANKLEARFKIIEEGGHFNEDAGYTKFPILLEDILKHIQQ